MTEENVEQIEEAVKETTQSGTTRAETAVGDKTGQETAKEAVSELEQLKAQIQEAEARAAEYLDGWQRSRADFINFRRRQEQMQSVLRQQMVSQLIGKLIAVLDDQERAFALVPENLRDHAWVEGLALVGRKLFTTLEKEGLSEMATRPGDEFDPNYHQAISHEPSTEFEDSHIIEVLHKGYNLQGQVLRPAIVRVSSGKVN